MEFHRDQLFGHIICEHNGRRVVLHRDARVDEDVVAMVRAMCEYESAVDSAATGGVDGQEGGIGDSEG